MLDAVLAVAAETGATPSQVSIAWLLAKPQVTSVIFGARTPAQLAENVGGAALKLTDAHLRRLDEASALDLGYPYQFIASIQKTW